MNYLNNCCLEPKWILLKRGACKNAQQNNTPEVMMSLFIYSLPFGARTPFKGL